MRYVFSIIMFCFAGAMFLYALIVNGDPTAIVRSYSVKMKNPKAYAKYFAKIIAVIALAPLLCGIYGVIFDPAAQPLMTAFISVDIAVVCIFLATRLHNPEN